MGKIENLESELAETWGQVAMLKEQLASAQAKALRFNQAIAYLASGDPSKFMTCILESVFRLDEKSEAATLLQELATSIQSRTSGLDNMVSTVYGLVAPTVARDTLVEEALCSVLSALQKAKLRLIWDGDRLLVERVSSSLKTTAPLSKVIAALPEFDGPLVFSTR